MAHSSSVIREDAQWLAASAGLPMERLVAEGQLKAFCHEGFWHPMETLRERNVLEHLWSSGRAPWKNWD